MTTYVSSLGRVSLVQGQGVGGGGAVSSPVRVRCGSSGAGESGAAVTIDDGWRCQGRQSEKLPGPMVVHGRSVAHGGIECGLACVDT